jgi:hypothetical protein
MTLAERVRDRLPERLAARLPGAPQPPPPEPPLPEPVSGAAVSPHGLGERRERLARELAEHQWDLGGIAYEMAIRDHFRLDVIVRRAADLQRIDAELGEVERLLHLERAGAAGSCERCDALHSRGAGFCWRCGLELVPAEVPHDLAGDGNGDDPRRVESNGTAYPGEREEFGPSGVGSHRAEARDDDCDRPAGRVGAGLAPTEILGLRREGGGDPRDVRSGEGTTDEDGAEHPDSGGDRFRRGEEDPGR